MTAPEYAVRQGVDIVRDLTWVCIADVIGSYHHSPYLTADRRVDGELIARRRGSAQWNAIYGAHG